MDTDSSEEEESAPAVRIPLGHRPVVFALPGSEALAAKVLQYLGWQAGLADFGRFDDGCVRVKVEETVTNHDVFVIYSREDTAGELHLALMRLLLFLSALRGESPYRLTLVTPCLDYCRQERRHSAGEGVAAALLLRCLRSSGAERFVTIDLHNEAEVGFAPDSVVVDELSSRKYLASFIRAHVPGFDPLACCVCATGGGGTPMTRRMAVELGTGLMMVDRIRPKGGGRGELKIMTSEAQDSIKAVVIVDDMFDTCSTLAEVCAALKAFAPRARIYAVASHGFFSGGAVDLIAEMVRSCNLEWLVVTNSMSQTGSLQRFREAGLDGRLKVVDVSRLLAGAMMRIYLGASVNLPKFRHIGPQEEDPMLQGPTSPKLVLERRHTDGPPTPLVL